MSMTRLFSLSIVLFAFIVQPASGQDAFRGEGGLAFTVGVPQGEFAEQNDNLGFGGTMYGAFGPATAPVLVGFEAGFLIYGHERRSEPFSTTIPDVTVDVTTSNNLVNGHLFARLQPASGVFRPFADALFGFKYLFTETSIRSEGFNDGDGNVASSTNFDDTAVSYGFGGGVQIQVFDGQHKADAPAAVYIELGGRYLFGSEAEYLKEGSIRRQNGQVEFDVTRSKTELLTINLGIGIRF